ncbi:c-type cytochrome [Sphingorhabdus contaminans]|uniref:Cytochrome c family protein n=1 Tax=Sphingorhabdus contaminans TaxID=1343899 RepID=A0A553WKC4_9SPHN|nr:cytochrome c family protein [Sphingorhabdus contaminans]TSB05118.1 cytochrome c family protein [Sphingorhabdus contaminans]
MDDRSNTIAGWVLAGGIAALGLSIASGMYFHSPAPHEPGYAIQGVESGEGGGEAAVPIGNMMATADMTKGEAIFKKCTACHTIAQGGPNGIGPNLWATVGKPLASHAGFAYSDALKSKGGTWTFEALNEWLTNPKKYAPGNKMTFAGLGNPEERAALLLYLNSQGSNLPLPSPVEAAVADAAADEAAAAAGTAPAADAAAPAADAAAAPAK